MAHSKIYIPLLNRRGKVLLQLECGWKDEYTDILATDANSLGSNRLGYLKLASSTQCSQLVEDIAGGK